MQNTLSWRLALSALMRLSERAKRVPVALSACPHHKKGALSAGLGLRAHQPGALLFAPPFSLTTLPSKYLFAPPLFTNCSLFLIFFCFRFRWLPTNAEPCPHLGKHQAGTLPASLQRSHGTDTRTTFSFRTFFRRGM